MESIVKLQTECPWCGTKVQSGFGNGCMSSGDHTYQCYVNDAIVGDGLCDLTISVGRKEYSFTYFLLEGVWGVVDNDGDYSNYLNYLIASSSKQCKKLFENIDHIKTYIKMISLLQ
jgi:hypothetical protein